MARKERKANVERLEGLLDAGDWRDARPEAERLSGSGDEGEREASARALLRLRSDPSARLGFAGGLVFLAVVAVIGLWSR